MKNRIIAYFVGIAANLFFAPAAYPQCSSVCYTQTECTDKINGGYQYCNKGRDFQGVYRCINGPRCGKSGPDSASLRKKEELASTASKKCAFNSALG